MPRVVSGVNVGVDGEGAAVIEEGIHKYSWSGGLMEREEKFGRGEGRSPMLGYCEDTLGESREKVALCCRGGGGVLKNGETAQGCGLVVMGAEGEGGEAGERCRVWRGERTAASVSG